MLCTQIKVLIFVLVAIMINIILIGTLISRRELKFVMNVILQ